MGIIVCDKWQRANIFSWRDSYKSLRNSWATPLKPRQRLWTGRFRTGRERAPGVVSSVTTAPPSGGGDLPGTEPLPGTWWSPSHVFSLLSLRTMSWNTYSCHPHFTDEETKNSKAKWLALWYPIATYAGVDLACNCHRWHKWNKRMIVKDMQIKSVGHLLSDCHRWEQMVPSVGKRVGKQALLYCQCGCK